MDKSKKRGVFYWKGEKPYVSVTEVLKTMDKGGGLMYWFGREIYYSVVKNPAVSEQEALRAPYNSNDKATERGRLIHSAIEAFSKNGIRVKPPEEYAGYINAFYKWVDSVKPEFIESEKSIFSEKYQYAGTCDALIKINGKVFLVDFKTSKDGTLYPEVELQLSGYANALKENNVHIDGAMAVAFSSKGNHSVKETEDVFDIFLALKKVWEWKNKEVCKKVQYESVE